MFGKFLYGPIWIMAFVVYFLFFIPAGVLLRIFRFDIIRLKIDKNKNTYWLEK